MQAVFVEREPFTIGTEKVRMAWQIRHTSFESEILLEQARMVVSSKKGRFINETSFGPRMKFAAG